MSDYVIVVAGGKGLRMGGSVPKQFQLLGGRPILMHTLQRFSDCGLALQIILVLPHEQHDYWQQLCQQYHFPFPQSEKEGRKLYLLADGGETRFHSVKNGLALIPDGAKGVVGVHDGVRPFVSREVIARCYEEARRHEAVVPVVPVVETLRHVSEGTKPRADYRLVQTPQTFSIPLLKAAYRQEFCDAFTDDASVVESFGHDITLVEGNRENIKLTTPFDMMIAETINYKLFTIHYSNPQPPILGGSSNTH